MKLRWKFILFAAASAALPLLVIGTARTQPVRGGAGQTAPLLAGLDPNTIAAGSPDFVLTVHGAFFVGRSVVHWNGDERATAAVNDTVLQARIPASDVASGGTARVTVVNPLLPNGHSGVSNVLAFRIMPESSF